MKKILLQLKLSIFYFPTRLPYVFNDLVMLAAVAYVNFGGSL